MRLPGETTKKWTEIANYGTASSTSTTSAIANLTNYNEFLVVLTPTGNTNRCLGSAIVPAALFLVQQDPSNGQTQVSDGTNSCGVSYKGNNQLKLYTGQYSGIAVYAR